MSLAIAGELLRPRLLDEVVLPQRSEAAEKRDASRALGSAVHAAIAENFRQKIETKEDLAIEGVIAMFRDRRNRSSPMLNSARVTTRTI